MSLFSRAKSLVQKLAAVVTGKQERTQPLFGAPAAPPTPPVGPEPTHQPEPSSFWDSFTSDPTLSGIPPGPEETGDAYLDIATDMGVPPDDRVAMNALYVGWFDANANVDDRHYARQFFFDYMDWDNPDFDWDAWREWYGEAA